MTATALDRAGVSLGGAGQATPGEAVEAPTLLTRVVQPQDGESHARPTIKTKPGVSQSNQATPTPTGVTMQNRTTLQSGASPKIPAWEHSGVGATLRLEPLVKTSLQDGWEAQCLLPPKKKNPLDGKIHHLNPSGVEWRLMMVLQHGEIPTNITAAM